MSDLKTCGGGFVLFADADDWLPRDAIETLYQKQQESDADYVSGNVISVELIRHRFLYLHDESAFVRTDVGAFDQFFTSHFIAYAPWAHLYKTKIIESAGLEFNTDMIFSEDAFFNYQYLLHCRKISTTSKKVYYYNRINPNATTKNYYSDRGMDEIRSITARRELYSDKLTQTQRFKEDDQLLFTFDLLCQDHVFFLTKEAAIEKLGETCNIFKTLLQKVGEYHLDTKLSDPIRKWIAYRQFVISEDYEGLYNYYNDSKKNYRNYENRFPLVRKILIFLRTFQLFTLKMGYQ